ncbi:hypothetical protein JZ751_003142 [Albula glossodonta]|uniref:Transmembrane protein 87A n=1 Tax=Albula glossodonta TaxID=121402 RepID=A0A8T2NA26_9TELE|nr:hypothetical protein JZ751_003142 [Albula glossodonta]
MPDRRMDLVYSLCFILILRSSIGAEVSRWNVDFTSLPNKVFRKTLFANTTIYMRFEGNLESCESNLASPLNVSWYLRSSACYNEVFNTPDSKAITMFGLDHMVKEKWSGYYSQDYILFHNCTDLLKPKEYYTEFATYQPLTSPESVERNPLNQSTSQGWLEKPVIGAVAKAWLDSPYLFIVKVQPQSLRDTTGGQQGAREEEELKAALGNFFYMGMVIIYVLFAALWLACSVWYWRDLLRIQFWIGAVILLGMLEKAVFYSEYYSIRYHGEYNEGAVIFAELLSALKRSLARILVLIVSLGYGIVKPRLGTTVPRLAAVGLLYLLFSSIEGVLRVTGSFYGTVALVANLSLSLIDSCVIFHIFISLSQTTRLLKLRRNVVKLSLYQHFTNTLIFSVLASIVFIIWTTKVFKLVDCQSGWRDLWVDDAFWRLLFSTILWVIMLLLRPSANSQRFSHSPLIDEDDDEDESKEPMLNEAFEGMKMRGTKPETNGAQKLLNKEDEDLKWVEENIPTTVADVALPVMLDEEEEILKTKMERSKME